MGNLVNSQEENINIMNKNLYPPFEMGAEAKCPTAHCERYKPHFDFGDIPSPIVPHRNKLQTQGGMTAH